MASCGFVIFSMTTKLDRAAWQQLAKSLLADVQARSSGRYVRSPESPHIWAEFRAVLASGAQAIRQLDARASDEDLEDVIHGEVLRLLSPPRAAALEAVTDPYAYFATVLSRRYLDLSRDRTRQGRAAERAEAESPSGPDEQEREGDALEELADAETRAMRIDRLRNALGLLRHEDQLLLQAIYWRGESLGDVARRLGIKPSTLAVRLFRVRRRLRETLGQNQATD
jgi:RNA polymerase sigma factor (sigma-70 family)